VECSPGIETHSDTSSSTASDIDDSEFEGPLEMFRLEKSEEDVLDNEEDAPDVDEPKSVVDPETEEDSEDVGDGKAFDEISERLPPNALYNEAEDGLRAVVGQFRLVSDRAEATIARFQEYISMTAADRPMKRLPSTNQYAGMVVLQLDFSWRTLGAIALRLEALVCNEAVTERTNGRIRRFLSPLHMRIGHASLSARRLISKDGRVRPESSAPKSRGGNKEKRF
jgi:hypothetical protein